MTSVILPPSIQTRLKIQRKFIHNKKDNRKQEGVYSKHTWKHFLLVRKSPLVLYSQIFPTGLFLYFLPLPLKTSLSLPPSSQHPFSRISSAFPKRDLPNLLKENPFLPSFLCLSTKIIKKISLQKKTSLVQKKEIYFPLLFSSLL